MSTTATAPARVGATKTEGTAKATMKAARIHSFGDPDVFQFEDAPVPEPKPGEVRIKILAAGVNWLEHAIRSGSFLTEDQMTFPRTLGADASGRIDAVANDVTEFEIGDKVIPVTGYPVDPADYDADLAFATPSFQVRGIHSNGTYAQYITAPARWVVKNETQLSHAEAATLPMVLETR